tara:strand:+ start:244 stop:471 length:228 start_codon:yes stop_codon:yes gene_type:complete
MKIIRAKQTNKEYQYSAYKVGWVFEVVNEYEDHYVAKVLSGSKEHQDGVMAVHKGDCEELHLGSYTDNEPITMMT